MVSWVRPNQHYFKHKHNTVVLCNISWQYFPVIPEVGMELGLLQSQQFELTSALKNVNLTRFSRELCKFSIIQNETVSDFISLDERVESTVKVRYLIQLVCDKVRREIWCVENTKEYW